MQQKTKTYTITDLMTIFHVSRSSIKARVDSETIGTPLIADGHIWKAGNAKNKKYQYYLFDKTALLKIADSFKGKISNRKSSTSNSGLSNNNVKVILKAISKLGNKMDLILKHLNIK